MTLFLNQNGSQKNFPKDTPPALLQGSSLVHKLQENLKKAQLAKDELETSTLRLLLSELHNTMLQKGQELSGDEIILVIQKEAKKRREAAAGFRQGQREDSAKKEEAELSILESYLPAQISDQELTKVVEDTINEIGANSMMDCGRVISKVLSGLSSGQADGSRVSSLVKEKLLS